MDSKAPGEGRDLFLQVFDSSPIPMTISRLGDGALLGINNAMLDLLGFRREEVLGKSGLQNGIIKPDARASVDRALGKDGTLRNAEIEVVCKDGEIRTLLTSTHNVELDGQACALATSIDITDRKRTEIFREGQNRVLEMMTMGSPVDEVLTALLRLTEGRSLGMLGSILLLAPDGLHILRGIAPSLPAPFAKAFDGFPIGPKAGSCGTAMHRGETVIVADIAADPLWEDYRAAAAAFGLRACWSMPIRSRTGEVMGSFAMYYREPREPRPQDIGLLEAAVRMAGLALEKERVESALKQVEEQFRQAQKMEAVGLLAGGIAHDFNNLLTAVIGYSEMAMQGLGVSHPVYGPVREILKAGDRAAGLTKQLLAYSRKQVLETKVWDLNVILEELVGMLRRFIGEDVILETAPGPAPAWVTVDRSQIEQMIMNLVVNARDAMPGGGKVRLEVGTTELDGSSDLFPGAEPGAYVSLAVSDTGTGMARDVLERIFEPFFTTKELGKGTGLGLSVVQGIIRQSGGAVAVRSEPGKGTAFHILLPRAKAAVAAAGAPGNDAGGSYRGSETILVVEDELLVRNLVCRVLESLGYRILQAGNGVEALRLLDATRGEISLVITDMVMPDLGGRDLALRIRGRRPDLPVLLMSGNADGGMEPGEPGGDLLRKPFSPSDLARKVRGTLDALRLR